MNHQVEVVSHGLQQDILAKQLINDIQQLGAVAVLERVESAFEKAALTQLLDYLESQDGRTALSRENSAWAANELLREAQSSSTQSSAGSRMMKRARLSALAKLATGSGEITRMLRQMQEDTNATGAAS